MKSKKLYQVIDVDGDGMERNIPVGVFKSDSIKKVYRHLQETYAPDRPLKEIPKLYSVEEIEPEEV